MFKTLRISVSLKNTYRVNSILYSLKQIPLLRRFLPSSLYQVKGFKILANILSVLWELLSLFLFKLLYFLFMVCGPEPLYQKSSPALVFLHILFFLTLIGSYLNNSFLSPRLDQYYAIVLLRMNARSYTLVGYGYTLVKGILGFLPFTLLFGLCRGVPLWLCLLIPFCVAGTKLAAAAYALHGYEKNGNARSENKLQKFAWLLTLPLLALAYLLPAAGLTLPFWGAAVLWLIWIPIGFFCLRRILSFGFYREINQELLAQLFQQMDAAKRAAKTASERAISDDVSITSRKKGFEYFNELFLRRHRKILWRSSLRLTAFLGILCCGSLIFLLFWPAFRPDVNQMVMTWLPYFTFIMYLINRGTNFTRALFMNCDHALLTYSFYKQPEFILKLFKIRLREIMKVNTPPALVISAGLCLILYVSGGTANLLNYLILAVSILSMSFFFSIHYLTIYYLLQPYTFGTEMKGGTYRVVTLLTYWGCYALMNLRLPIILFGAACIVFCLIYSVLACILVYRFAPQTFRLRI